MSQGINLNQTSGVVCVNCGSQSFKEAVLLRKVSRFITNQPNDAIMPIPIFECSKCGTICKDALDPRVVEVIFDEAEVVDGPQDTKIVQP